MAINLWGAAFSPKASPLYDFESRKESSIPPVNLIDKILDEGNCVRVTDRGEEASKRSIGLATGSDIRQSCEVTYRNPIQGRCEEASGPTITKPFSKLRIGKLGACAAKVNRLILGELQPESGSRLYAESRNGVTQVIPWLQQSAEVVVRTCYTPLTAGRTEP